VRAVLCACAIASALGTPAQALQVYENLGPKPRIANVAMDCGGVNTYVADIPDIAMAERGRLLLRQDFFSLPAPIQWFVYTHECAHQTVGGNEGAADCLAVKRGRKQGLFTPEVVQQICDYVSPLPQDRTHLSGPQRCEHIQSCFDAP